MSLQIRHVPLPDAASPLALADWRQRVNALYAEIQACDDTGVAWQRWCDTRSWLFKHHPMSPIPAELRDAYGGVPVYRYNPQWRFAVDVVPVRGETIHTDVGDDGRLSFSPLCQTTGLSQKLGRELTVWWVAGYGGGLFLPFKDHTSGAETYGGGRYLLDSIKGANLGTDQAGQLVLDFNFAYFPSCAHNPAYVCPLSPAENVLDVAVKAGERWPE